MAKNPAYAKHRIGQGTYGWPIVLYDDQGAELVIGRYSSIARGVVILLGGNHRTDWVTSYPFPLLCDWARGYHGYPSTKGHVSIGSDVWVGRDAMILSGVRIEDGAVVGARAVVASDVPPFAVAVGNPARVVGYRFDAETIDALQRIQWWNWSVEDIRGAMPLLLSGDIAAFVSAYDPGGQR